MIHSIIVHVHTQFLALHSSRFLCVSFFVCLILFAWFSVSFRVTTKAHIRWLLNWRLLHENWIHVNTLAHLHCANACISCVAQSATKHCWCWCIVTILHLLTQYSNTTIIYKCNNVYIWNEIPFDNIVSFHMQN